VAVVTQIDFVQSELKRPHSWQVVRAVRTNPLLLFFLLAYAIAWVGWSPLVLSRAGIGIIPVNVPIEYIVLPSFAPSIAALLTQRFTQGNFRFLQLFAPRGRDLSGIIIGPVLIVIAFVIIPGVLITKSPVSLHWSVFGAGSLSGVVNWSALIHGPIGEEPGWRGYALPKLQAREGPFIGSLILACLWAVWHLPLFWVKEWTHLPFSMFFWIVTAVTLLMTYVANISRFIVIVAVLMHATYNISATLLSGLVASVPMRTMPPPYVVYSLAPFALALILVACTRGRLGSTDVHTDSSSPGAAR